MYRLYVERRPGFENEARRYLSEINGFLGIAGVKAVRYFNRYDIENVSDEVAKNIESFTKGEKRSRIV